MRVDKRQHTAEGDDPISPAVLSMGGIRDIGMKSKVGDSEPCRVKTENPPYTRQDPPANTPESATRPMNRFNHPVIPWLRTRAK